MKEGTATPLHDKAATALQSLRTEAGLTATVSLLPATLVTGCANLAAHQLHTIPNGVAAAAITVAMGYLGVKGVSHKWDPRATWMFLGASAATLDVAVAVAGTGFMDLIAWAAFAAGSFGGRLAYLHGTAEKRAKTKTEGAKAEALQAKISLTLLKAQTEQVVAELKTAQLIKAMAPEPAAYQPNLIGHTAEETSLRIAFWDVHEAELVSCAVESTQTGYKATLGLPVSLPREQVRTQWDKISSALRADGRFVLDNGRLTNELVAKFIDASKRPDMDVTWSLARISKDPLQASLGINTETCEEVFIHADERTLVCGASGTGKSWSTRPLMAHAVIHGDLAIADAKGEEGTVWSGIARVAIEADEICGLIDEVHEEMNTRKMQMRKRGESVWSGTQLTLAIDEGQVVLAVIRSDKEEATERLQRLRELSSLGRSRGIVMLYATQKPTMSGAAPGIDNLIAPNMLQRFSLRVADEQEARTALDDCAHYGPNLIPDRREMRGHGYLKGYGPSLIQTWTMDDAAVRSLTPKIWGTDSLKGAFTISNEDKVARFLLAHPGANDSEIARETGVSRSSVQRIRKTL